jgi:hypothetical protein
MDGGYLRVAHLPAAAGGADPERALLIVSGANIEALKLAAVTFANITFPFPGGDEVKAYEFSLPELAKYSGRQVLTPGRPYDFKTLNLPTQTLRGLNPGPREITFRLPPDFHIRPNQYAKLQVQFAYGAGLRPDASLSVGVNGRSVRAILLSKAEGDFIERYRLDVPTFAFRPGINTLNFTPHFAIAGQSCDFLQTEGLFITLYENSTIEFPAMPHFVEMPRMDLFLYNGYPFTRWPDGHGSSMLLGEKHPAIAAAALNLVGMITQKNGFPLFGIEVGYGGALQGDVLAIGRQGTLPEALRAAAPLRPAARQTVPYPVVRAWENEVTLAYSTQTGSLGPGRALMAQFESPVEKGRTVLLLTGESVEDVVAGSEAVLDPGVQARSDGDLVVIDQAEPEPRVTALRVSRRYITGERGNFSGFESYLYTNPAIYYFAMAGLAFLLLLGVVLGLRSWRARKARARPQ